MEFGSSLVFIPPTVTTTSSKKEVDTTQFATSNVDDSKEYFDAEE